MAYTVKCAVSAGSSESQLWWSEVVGCTVTRGGPWPLCLQAIGVPSAEIVVTTVASGCAILLRSARVAPGGVSTTYAILMYAILLNPPARPVAIPPARYQPVLE